MADISIDQIKKLENEVAEPEIWTNPENARNKNEELAHLNNEVEPWKTLKTQLKDINELFGLAESDLESELKEQIDALENELTSLKKSLRFTGKYDDKNAILRITAGVGGVEAMDWSGMLERMYLRFCEKNNFKASSYLL